MAEDTKEPEATEVVDEATSVATKSYLLQSVVRGRHNRTKRAEVPGRQPFVQRLAGGRIIVRRARPARISEAVLIAHLAEIKATVAKHQVVVTTLDGRSVDLSSFEVGTLAANSPLPNPPLDSAKNDKNEGVGYDVPGAPEGTTLNSPEPELLKPSSLLIPGGLSDEEEDEDEESEPETTPVPPTLTPQPTAPGQRQQGKKRGRS